MMFEVGPKQDAAACLPVPLSRIGPVSTRDALPGPDALPSRDCEGSVTKTDCSLLLRLDDNCFPHNRLE